MLIKKRGEYIVVPVSTDNYQQPNNMLEDLDLPVVTTKWDRSTRRRFEGEQREAIFNKEQVEAQERLDAANKQELATIGFIRGVKPAGYQKKRDQDILSGT